MGKRVFLLHPGYGKTGTTTLQKSFFDALAKREAIHYFGMFLDAPKGHPDRVFFDRLQSAMYLDSGGFEAELPNLKEALAAAEARSGLTVPMVLSNEHFMLSSYSTREPGVTIRSEETARRLARVLDSFDVRLLIGVRRQDAMIPALFNEAAARTDHKNASHFEDLFSFIAEATKDGSLFHSMFDFSSAISHYEAAFPKAPIKFYAYECFVSKQLDLLKSICRLIDISESLMQSIECPLPNLNAKKRMPGGVIIAQRSGIVKLTRSLPGGVAMANALGKVSALRLIYDKVRPKRQVPNLTKLQSLEIMNAFAASNYALARRHPDLCRIFQEHQYARCQTDTVVVDQ